MPLLLALSLLFAGRARAVLPPSNISTPSSVMWIAAHPDDESIAAPLLGKWCRQEGARCAFLILTRGEGGTCLRSDGCHPDIASVRSGEAGSASQYFGATSILLTCPNTAGVDKPDWRSVSGDRPDVVTTVAHYIEAFHPSLVLTFDPRHGTTCHPDHMETGAIVLDAVKLLSYEPDLYLLETRVTFAFDPLVTHFAPAVGGLQRFDANEILTSSQTSAWSEITQDMARHPSQFDGSWLAAIENVPASDRAVYIAPAKSILGVQVSGCQ
ncbi:MAG TPA: PIG-L family deacetylase [Thermoanaerobaculia bacterium]|jgi:LmbE family N-acetylglucosaminyl deacetylase|nr:PIG-L family deacetylase [Thermoanaerobaculia bacterium]